MGAGGRFVRCWLAGGLLSPSLLLIYRQPTGAEHLNIGAYIMPFVPECSATWERLHPPAKRSRAGVGSSREGAEHHQLRGRFVLMRPFGQPNEARVAFSRMGPPVVLTHLLELGKGEG